MTTEKQRAQMRLYNETHKEELEIYQRAYGEAHKEKKKAYSRVYYKTHKEEKKAQQRIYYESHKEEIRAQRKDWNKVNSDKVNANQARQIAQRLKRSPFWITSKYYKEMRIYYTEAQVLTKSTGIPHHVDHIIPLQGKNVSGLHVPWNLQVITAEENLKKGNRL